MNDVVTAIRIHVPCADCHCAAIITLPMTSLPGVKRYYARTTIDADEAFWTLQETAGKEIGARDTPPARANGHESYGQVAETILTASTFNLGAVEAEALAPLAGAAELGCSSTVPVTSTLRPTCALIFAPSTSRRYLAAGFAAPAVPTAPLPPAAIALVKINVVLDAPAAPDSAGAFSTHPDHVIGLPACDDGVAGGCCAGGLAGCCAAGCWGAELAGACAPSPTLTAHTNAARDNDHNICRISFLLPCRRAFVLSLHALW